MVDSLDFDLLDSAPVSGTNGVYGERGVHIIGQGIQFQRGLAVINLSLIPEPNTLGLLALASAFTLRRRRQQRPELALKAIRGCDPRLATPCSPRSIPSSST